MLGYGYTSFDQHGGGVNFVGQSYFVREERHAVGCGIKRDCPD